MKTYYHIFYMFIAYSFLGWVLEVLYHVYKDKRFVNRGFLHGPLCPIYGTTAVVLASALTPVSGNYIYIFLGGAVAASVVELVTGYLMEELFQAKWWDYSKEKYNIMGYICLKFSIIWGFLSIVFIKFINPFVLKYVYLIEDSLGAVFYNIILILLIVDATLTINSLIAFRKLFTEIQEVILQRKENLERLLEKNISIEVRDNLQQKINQLGEIKDRLIKKVSFKHKIILNAYPKISSRKFNAALDEVKKLVDNLHQKLNG